MPSIHDRNFENLTKVMQSADVFMQALRELNKSTSNPMQSLLVCDEIRKVEQIRNRLGEIEKAVRVECYREYEAGIKQFINEGKMRDAQRCLENYNFNGLIIDQVGTWDTSDPADYIVVLTAEPEDDNDETLRLSFHVRFDDDGVSEVYAFDIKTGNDIGKPGEDVAANAIPDMNEDDKVSDHYDSCPMFAELLNRMIPGFEYPDWSHKTIGEALESLGASVEEVFRQKFNLPKQNRTARPKP